MKNPADMAAVEALLIERHPEMVVAQLGTAAAKIWGSGDIAPKVKAFYAAIELERQQLLALPPDELKALTEAHQARQSLRQQESNTKKRTKAAAKEAARFYNLPSASADFAYWCKCDFWTVAEATALLLGKDPLVVNPGALKQEARHAPGFRLGSTPDMGEFHRRFDRLHRLLSRADIQSGGTIRPADAASWAARTDVVKLPPEIQALAPKANALEQPPSPGSEPTLAAEVPAIADPFIKKSALIRKHARAWPTIESDLRHAIENGLSAVAKGAKHGMWDEPAALRWAMQNGKTRTDHVQVATANQPWPGRIHTLKG